jgi:predicted DNA repair protein MutK
MPTGLVALLDDISVIARAAAASLDDVGLAAAKAGSKAAGVVVDDAAVTPTYVTDFTPDRELPIIWKIAKGSIKNKLVFLLPAALALSVFLPVAIPVLLIVGGAYLCFEGAEKVLEKFGGEKHGDTLGDPIADLATFEQERVSGAIRTDFILSAEIMAIALAEVADTPIVERGVVLAVVGIAITVLVYGAVALIVKMDDVGLHLAEKPQAAVRKLGRGLVAAMPILLMVIASVGTLAMLWVGGSIILHQLAALGLAGPEHAVEAIEHAVTDATGALGGVFGWLSFATSAALFGLALGAIVAVAVHMVQKATGLGKGAN